MIFLRVIKWLKYSLLSGHYNGHGIHSPFIFSFVVGVLRNKTGTTVVNRIEEIRKLNLADKRVINIDDLGAGSVSMKSSLRKISQIARSTSVPVKYGALLGRIAGAYGKDSVIELGTSLGISTMYMAAGAPGSLIYTIEGSEAVANAALVNFERAGLTNIKVLKGNFDDMLPYLLKSNNAPGMVYIDGNHRREATLKYFGMILSGSSSGVVIVIDDIYLTKEMEQAWEEIKETEDAVTVDIFRMGIVFIRMGLKKQHYIIRY
jgi:predicted O-methyltransferase YrrM